MLEECIENFGMPPRRFSWWAKNTYLSVPRPDWLPGDRMATQFDYMNYLLCDGVVVWSHIVQANVAMFKPGRHDCPAVVVFSFDRRGYTDPEYLADVAHDLFALKHTKPGDPALAEMARLMTDELERFYGVRVPRSISPTFECFISVTLLFRKFLPNGHLRCSAFPTIVYPKPPHVAVVLPKKFWPRQMREAWSQGHLV